MFTATVDIEEAALAHLSSAHGAFTYVAVGLVHEALLGDLVGTWAYGTRGDGWSGHDRAEMRNELTRVARRRVTAMVATKQYI